MRPNKYKVTITSEDGDWLPEVVAIWDIESSLSKVEIENFVEVALGVVNQIVGAVNDVIKQESCNG